jgi:hypothetical protein
LKGRVRHDHSPFFASAGRAVAAFGLNGELVDQGIIR